MGNVFYMLGACLAYSPAIVSFVMLRNGVSRWTAAGVGVAMYAVIFGTIFALG